METRLDHLCMLGVIVAAMAHLSAAATDRALFEGEPWAVRPTPLDQPVLARLRERGIEPANPCSDAVFVRRVFLDVTGSLPTPDEVRAFLSDRSPAKRRALIDDLLERPAYADYWAWRWCDLLRVKSEFPINLWPNAVQAYHRWIRDAVRDNRPYDRFAHDLLTSSGSNFRVPAVNFYRGIQGNDPATIAAAVGLTFLGTRVEHWPADKQIGLQAFFSRIIYKGTAEWKEQIVICDPVPDGPLAAAFPDGTVVSIPADQDPRRIFANWLISADNPWFARVIANRMWFWIMGRGIVHEPDDFGPHNPPVNPALLDLLTEELVDADFDLKHLLRLILNSRTYQQSPLPAAHTPDGASLFAHYPLRRLEAEVLLDAINTVFGTGDEYSSPIPEPFTYIPASERTISLADGSITSPFLEQFGRPPRDTGLASERTSQPTDEQRLSLLNSAFIQTKIEGSSELRRLAMQHRRQPGAIIAELYLKILSRPPRPAELATIGAYFDAKGANPRQGIHDLCWALINSKEFLYRH